MKPRCRPVPGVGTSSSSAAESRLHRLAATLVFLAVLISCVVLALEDGSWLGPLTAAGPDPGRQRAVSAAAA